MNECHILWRRVDIEGRDACRLTQVTPGWSLCGTAIYRDNGVVTAVTYQIDHDDQWRTHAARITGWSGDTNIDLQIARLANGIWTVNDRVIAALEGCIDVDLGFSPATNTSAIRRLALGIGQKRQSRAVWLDETRWQMKPLEQCYLRTAENRYEYSSPEHEFRAEISTNDVGLVVDYPGIWTIVR